MDKLRFCCPSSSEFIPPTNLVPFVLSLFISHILIKLVYMSFDYVSKHTSFLDLSGMTCW